MSIIIMCILVISTLFFIVTSLLTINKKNTIFNLTVTRCCGVLGFVCLLFYCVCTLVNEELKQKLAQKPEKYELVNEQFYRKIK